LKSNNLVNLDELYVQNYGDILQTASTLINKTINLKENGLGKEK
jgi:hypothetical protein